MAFYLNNAITSVRVASVINNNYTKLANSIENLSTGLKVNSSADDPATYALSSSMVSDITVTQQGIRNANDAISMLQTADGALQVIDEQIIRMKELAEQAATGTYDSTQRAIIDSEYQAMASEITRISESTNFNGIKLLDGNLSSEEFVGNFYGDFSGSLKIHYGTSNNSNKDYTLFSLDSMTAASLGIGNSSDPNVENSGYSISTQEGASNALVALEEAISSKAMVRAEIGALQNRLENTVYKLELEVENLQSAESKLVDVDVATEMTKFTTQQIILQSATSLMTQANTAPQQALDLLLG